MVTGDQPTGGAGDWSCATDFAADDSSVSGARDFVSVHLLEHGVAYLVEDVQLVVSELATNAILHAQTGFMVVLGSVEEEVRLEVLDGSRTGPVLGYARALDVGGRGVAIVDAVSRNWGVVNHASGGKTVWAKFDRDPA